MILCEAREQIASRLGEVADDYRYAITEYIEALEIAVKCIDAQMRLMDIINDMSGDSYDDTWTVGLVRDVLEECRYDWSEEDMRTSKMNDVIEEED